MSLSNCKIKLLIFFTLAITLLNSYAHSEESKFNFFDNFDPKSPEAQKQLEQLDRDYESITGKSAHVDLGKEDKRWCYKQNCHLWAVVDLNLQRLFLYVDGTLTYTWKTSTGRFGYETPAMDTRPDGRMYEKHTSPKYPEGDYNGLGNMPFAVFVDGDYAIHGTTRGSWWRLGTPASHGCIRLHPDNAEMFYVMVRRSGIQNVWVTIE